MRQLWAPWRLEFIEGKNGEPARRGAGRGCIFCNASKTKDLVVYNGRLSVVLLNKYPYNNAHLLIAPKRHCAILEKLPKEESMDLQNLLSRAVKILKKVYKPEGFNLGMNIGHAGGAGIADHLHWHIVPRWRGDTNFMAVVSEIRVMPEHLNFALKKLKPHFDRKF